MSELCPPPPGASPSAERPVYEPQRGPLRAEGPGPRAGSVRSPLPARGSTHDDAMLPGLSPALNVRDRRLTPCPHGRTDGPADDVLLRKALPAGRGNEFPSSTSPAPARVGGRRRASLLRPPRVP